MSEGIPTNADQSGCLLILASLVSLSMPEQELSTEDTEGTAGLCCTVLIPSVPQLLCCSDDCLLYTLLVTFFSL